MSIDLNVLPYPVGGAVVCRRFTAGGKTYTRGMRIPAAEFLSWSNRRMLKSAGYVEVFPAPDDVPSVTKPAHKR